MSGSEQRDAPPARLEGPDPADVAWERARHFNAVQRYENAEIEALRGLAMRPQDAALHFELARSHLARERLEAADEALGVVLGLDPQFTAAFGLRAYIAGTQGRFGQAEQLVLQGLHIDPEDAFLYEQYGDVMRSTGHADKARRLYLKALELAPDDADVHAKLALLESGRLRAAAARVHAAQGLGHGPEGALAHAGHGAALLRSGRPFQARAAFRQAVRLDPSNDSLQEAWLQADLCCRLVYLPMYFYSLLVERVPGRQFTVWGVVILGTGIASKLGAPGEIIVFVMLGYILLCLYTWIATPLVKVWVKIVKPKP